MKKNCTVCDTEFESKQPHAKYCGKECSNQATSNRLKEKSTITAVADKKTKKP